MSRRRRCVSVQRSVTVVIVSMPHRSKMKSSKNVSGYWPECSDSGLAASAPAAPAARVARARVPAMRLRVIDMSVSLEGWLPAASGAAPPRPASQPRWSRGFPGSRA